jgi:hypothetical protein
MYNLVQLDNDGWYWYDLTWDDHEVEYYSDSSSVDRGTYYYFCKNDTETLSSTTKSTFLTRHDYYKTNENLESNHDKPSKAFAFLYKLPDRAENPFSDSTQTLLYDEFTIDNVTYSVCGYHAVEVVGIGKSDVRFPETVTYNGIAFAVDQIGTLTDNTADDDSLTSVTLSKWIKYVQYSSFIKLGLANIYVDEENPDFTSQDGVLFNGSCTTLVSYPSGNTRTEYDVPKETTGFFRFAFALSKNLTKVTLSENVKELSELLFYECTNLSDVVMNEGLTTIGYGAFYECTSLKNIKIPNSVTDIGESAFEGCTGLESVTFGNGATTIEDAAFYGCTSLDNVVLNGVTTIGNAAFYGCTGLTSLTIGSSVTEIGSYAFYGCTGLTSLTIPDSVTMIGTYAFYECSNLKSVEFENTSGWKYGASANASSWTSITEDLSDASTAATCLTTSYYKKVWKCV